MSAAATAGNGGTTAGLGDTTGVGVNGADTWGASAAGIDVLGIADKREKDVGELSGGMGAGIGMGAGTAALGVDEEVRMANAAPLPCKDDG